MQSDPPFQGNKVEESFSGSCLTTISTAREMRIYAVNESELDTVGVMHNAATVCFSIFSSIAVFACEKGIDLLLMPADTPASTTGPMWKLMMFLVVAAAGSLALGVLASRTKGTIIRTIKDKSIPRQTVA